ncbi:MAG: hypothetical protein JWO52_5119 [Gammaproteobacteria bacterium]|nr:hypothetical protein [Gammaproteobacteria bacterium]
MPPKIASARIPDRTVESRVNYIGPMTERPRYYADDGSRDNLRLDPRTIRVDNARLWVRPPSLAREGFALISNRSAVSDFRNPEEIARIHQPETERLLLELTNADKVVIFGPAVRRSAHRSSGPVRLTSSGPLCETRSVCFVHIDVSDSTAALFSQRCLPKGHSGPVRRFAHYNIWRALSPPPQDFPLALCDSRSVSASDLVEADAMMDIPGKPESSYVGLVVRYNSRHRWSHFPDMNRDEVIVFKTHDSDPAHPSHVPHTAFNDPTCPSGVAPRSSIETRAIAYWLES